MKIWTRLMKRWSQLVFQDRYKEITPHIRVLRLLEEVMELSQAEHVSIEEVDIIKNQVFNRPAGEPFQELGGVLTTLAGYASIRGFDLEETFMTEFERMIDPVIIEKVRHRNLEGDKIGFNKTS